MSEVAPESRARRTRPAGIPIVLSDGATWHLADMATRREVDGLRDELFDSAALISQVPTADVHWAAYAALAANYDLTIAEMDALFDGVDPDAVRDAAMDALFGPSEPERSYSAWMRSSLIANNIDPASVPGTLIKHVLDLLVSSGRAMPLDTFSEAASFAGQRRQLLGLVKKPEAAAAEGGGA